MIPEHLARVLWARRWIVLIATLSCLLGGVVMLLTTPKRYDAAGKVELLYIKPDPITGFKVTQKNAAAYINSQIQTIRDDQVAGLAAEQMGWLDSPDLQAAYAELPAGTDRDFPHWVAQRIIDGTYVRPVQDSNMLEIRFRAVSPQAAVALATALRDAYVSDSGRQATAQARGSLPMFTEQMKLASTRLTELENEKSAIERQTGVVLQENKKDIDSVRLQAMASDIRSPVVEAKADASTSSAAELARMDYMMESATRALGPNHPQLLALKQRRTLLATQIAQEKGARDSIAAAVQNQGRITAGEMSSQVAKVLSQGETLMKLRLLRDAIDVQRTRYSKASEHYGQAAGVATGAISGARVRSIGVVEGPQTPVYPNNALVLGGTGGLGLAAGILLAFMAELWARRVRTESDLGALVAGSSVVVLPKIKRQRARLGWLRRTPAQAARA